MNPSHGSPGKKLDLFSLIQPRPVQNGTQHWSSCCPFGDGSIPYPIYSWFASPKYPLTCWRTRQSCCRATCLYSDDKKHCVTNNGESAEGKVSSHTLHGVQTLDDLRAWSTCCEDRRRYFLDQMLNEPGARSSGRAPEDSDSSSSKKEKASGSKEIEAKYEKLLSRKDDEIQRLKKQLLELANAKPKREDTKISKTKTTQVSTEKATSSKPASAAKTPSKQNAADKSKPTATVQPVEKPTDKSKPAPPKAKSAEKSKPVSTEQSKTTSVEKARSNSAPTVSDVPPPPQDEEVLEVVYSRRSVQFDEPKDEVQGSSTGSDVQQRESDPSSQKSLAQTLGDSGYGDEGEEMETTIEDETLEGNESGAKTAVSSRKGSGGLEVTEGDGSGSESTHETIPEVEAVEGSGTESPLKTLTESSLKIGTESSLKIGSESTQEILPPEVDGVDDSGTENPLEISTKSTQQIIPEVDGVDDSGIENALGTATNSELKTRRESEEKTNTEIEEVPDDGRGSFGEHGPESFSQVQSKMTVGATGTTDQPIPPDDSVPVDNREVTTLSDTSAHRKKHKPVEIQLFMDVNGGDGAHNMQGLKILKIVNGRVVEEIDPRQSTGIKLMDMSCDEDICKADMSFSEPHAPLVMNPGRNGEIDFEFDLPLGMNPMQLFAPSPGNVPPRNTTMPSNQQQRPGPQYQSF